MFSNNDADFNSFEEFAMKKIVLFLVIVFFLFPGKTQCLTWAFTYIVENDDATNHIITADPTRSNLGTNTIQIMPFNKFDGKNTSAYRPDFYILPAIIKQK